MITKRSLNGPWSFDNGQLRDRDGNALASFPIFPGGIGDQHDKQNGELCALVPDLLEALNQLVNRCKDIPMPGNEGMRTPLVAEATALLERAKTIESSTPKE